MIPLGPDSPYVTGSPQVIDREETFVTKTPQEIFFELVAATDFGVEFDSDDLNHAQLGLILHTPLTDIQRALVVRTDTKSFEELAQAKSTYFMSDWSVFQLAKYQLGIKPIPIEDFYPIFNETNLELNASASSNLNVEFGFIAVAADVVYSGSAFDNRMTELTKNTFRSPEYVDIRLSKNEKDMYSVLEILAIAKILNGSVSKQLLSYLDMDYMTSFLDGSECKANPLRRLDALWLLKIVLADHIYKDAKGIHAEFDPVSDIPTETYEVPAVRF